MSIRDIANQDNKMVGASAILLSELGCAAVLLIVLLALGIAPLANINYWSLIFIPALFTLRYYMKKKIYLTTTKSAIVTLAITFIAYMALFIKFANINKVL
ncbi:MAG: hypothetical protein MJZ51_03935 [Bacteroidales bacterium]|nr:hypothetical protein [Bacteroidales bacterium]